MHVGEHYSWTLTTAAQERIARPALGRDSTPRRGSGLGHRLPTGAAWDEGSPERPLGRSDHRCAGGILGRWVVPEVLLPFPEHHRNRDHRIHRLVRVGLLRTAILDSALSTCNPSGDVLGRGVGEDLGERGDGRRRIEPALEALHASPPPRCVSSGQIGWPARGSREPRACPAHGARSLRAASSPRSARKGRLTES
jgi:hypothetical protein